MAGASTAPCVAAATRRIAVTAPAAAARCAAGLCAVRGSGGKLRRKLRSYSLSISMAWLNAGAIQCGGVSIEAAALAKAVSANG